MNIPGGDLQRFAKDYVWIWQDWKTPRRNRGRAKDPGVSIWQEQYSTGESAGDYLRDKLKEIAYSKSGIDKITTTLDIADPSLYKYPLSGTVSDVDMPRFGPFHWANVFNGPIKDEIMKQFDPDTVAALDRLNEFADDVRESQEQLEKVQDYIRDQLGTLIGKPEFLEEMEETKEELEANLDEFLEEIDNYTLDKVVPDSFANNCL